MYKYQKSAYAVNKFSENIVYLFADGTSFEVSFEKFIAENPTKTFEDFKALKECSDKLYHDEDRAEWREKSKNVPLETAEFCEEIFVPSAETVMFENSEREEFEQKRRNIAKKVLEKLTETQRRRYILHVVNGLTTREIADLEGISQRTVMDSIEGTEKKIKKILKSFKK